MTRKFLAVLMAVAVWAGSAEAMSITADFAPDLTPDGEGFTYLHQGDSFTYTFTAHDAIGNVIWVLSASDGTGNSVNTDGEGNIYINGEGLDISLSSLIGNTTQLTGKFLSLNSHWLTCDITALDENGPVSYFLWFDDADFNRKGNDSEDISPIAPLPSLSEDIPSTDISPSPQNQAAFPQGRIIPIASSDLQSGVLEKIAASAGISVSNINFITQLDISEAPEPTQAMRDNASNENLEFAAKFQTVTFSKAGYYLFEVDFPQELVGTNVNDLKFYFTSTNTSSSVQSSQALALMVDRFLAGNELRNLLGDLADTVPGRALILLTANTGGSFAMYALKTILMLLAGGCTAGIGAVTIVVMCSLFFWKR
ncbi:MAG: hypothetical protein IJR85_05925 [Synergistaceae bacterium]|nr:hypothetical protein [Synergistaceae bacterium]